jgi:glycosyltransferase involved in cell wall biosynthesis
MPAHPPPRGPSNDPAGAQALISVLMVEVASPQALEAAVAAYNAQDHAQRELVVVLDGPRGWQRWLPAQDDIRIVDLPAGTSSAVRRDYAVQISRGAIIVFWDDGIVSLPGRLSAQSLPIRRGDVNAVELCSSLYFHPADARWSRRPATQRLASTVCFRRSLWPGPGPAGDATPTFADSAALDGDACCFRVWPPSLPLDGQWQAATPLAAALRWQELWGRRLVLREPLVTCVMPTADRPEMAVQALRQFLDQTYESRELVIVDAGVAALGPLLPSHPQVRYVRATPGQTIGALRNLGCAHARGELIAHWDDDDWMAPWRLRYQVGELLSSDADICGLARLHFVDPVAGQAWQYRYPEDERPWVAGGTMCYRRELWQRQPFPDLQVGEDNAFVWSQAVRGVLALADERFYVATVHRGNTSPKLTHSERWHPRPLAEVRRLVGADWEPMRRRFQAPAPVARRMPAAVRQGWAPRVSCVMATGDRPGFVRQAIRCFLRQGWRDAELLVVDDGEVPVDALCAGLPDVRYIRCAQPMSLGAKLNLGIEQAAGDVIQKLDDDDHYGPDFLAQAVAALGTAPPGRALVAWCCFLVLLPGEPHPRQSGHGWAAGASLCFDKLLWQRTRVRDLPRAVDQHFIQDAQVEVMRVCRPESLQVVRHRRNTWRELTDATPVEAYFRAQPAHERRVLDIVEPIDAAFYSGLIAATEPG